MSQRLPRRVGLSRAREMMLTGRTYGGTAALAMGLVNFCVSEGSFEAESFDLGIPIARISAFCWKLMARPSVRALRTWTLLTKVETSCDRTLIAGGANVEAEWEQGPAV